MKHLDKAGIKKENSQFVLIILIFLCFNSCASNSAIVPEWFLNPEEAYPSSKYIRATGEGKSLSEARENALTQISLYFDTSIQVSRDLISNYNHINTNNNSQYFEQKSVQEQAVINSEAQLYCVNFSSFFRDRNTFYIVAYIDKEEAYENYKQNIQLNTQSLAHLIKNAETYENPFYCVPAIQQGIRISRMTTTLLKNIKTLKIKNEDFSQTQSLIERMYNAQEQTKSKMTIKLVVENDRNALIYRTISQQIEQKGISLSQDNGSCILKAVVNQNRIENEAGVFVTLGIIITAHNEQGEVIFSYTRSFPRQGAPVDYEDTAWRKAYDQIQQELQESFIQEFNAKIFGE